MKTADRPGSRRTRSGTPLAGAPDRVALARGAWDWLAFVRRRPSWADLARASRPAIIFLTLGLLVGTGGFLAYRAREQPHGKSLLADAASSKLNATSAEAAARSATAPHSEPGTLSFMDHKVGPAVAEGPPSFDHLPISHDLSASGSPLADATSAIRNPHRGDTPMIHHWRMLGLHTLLSAAMTVIPASAQEKAAEPNKDTVLLTQLKELQDSVNKLDGKIESGNKNFELLNQRLTGVQTDIRKTQDDLMKSGLDVEGLRQQIAKLRADLDEMNKKMLASSVVSSRYAPTNAASGQVRLVNTYSEPVTIIVNGRAYPVRPNETRVTEPIPAGTFTYEVLGVQAARSPQIGPSETFTINVHPR